MVPALQSYPSVVAIGTIFGTKKGSCVMVSARPRTVIDECSPCPVEPHRRCSGDRLGHESRTTVLVVDDEPQLLELLRTVFEDEGFDVLCAADGEVAWDLWQHRSPSIVITDVMMPALDGYGLLRRLQDALETPHPPVILMTAAPPRSGSVPVPLVGKPFDIVELVTLVDKVVGNSGGSTGATPDMPA